MSNVPMGPDWWQASDGRWYPPQPQPQPVRSSGRSERTPAQSLRNAALVVAAILGTSIAAGQLFGGAVDHAAENAADRNGCDDDYGRLRAAMNVARRQGHGALDEDGLLFVGALSEPVDGYRLVLDGPNGGASNAVAIAEGPCIGVADSDTPAERRVACRTERAMVTTAIAAADMERRSGAVTASWVSYVDSRLDWWQVDANGAVVALGDDSVPC